MLISNMILKNVIDYLSTVGCSSTVIEYWSTVIEYWRTGIEYCIHISALIHQTALRINNRDWIYSEMSLEFVANCSSELCWCFDVWSAYCWLELRTCCFAYTCLEVKWFSFLIFVSLELFNLLWDECQGQVKVRSRSGQGQVRSRSGQVQGQVKVKECEVY